MKFNVVGKSLTATTAQAQNRSPAAIAGSQLQSLAPVEISLPILFGVPPHPVFRIDQAWISARIGAGRDGLADGLIGGVLPMAALSELENPYCPLGAARCLADNSTSTILDLIGAVVGPQPDVDVDGDGRECVIDTDGDGAIDLCCDGFPGQDCRTLQQCPGATVGPVVPGRPASCALDPRMADGYSVAFSFTAVPAHIVGVE